ncbi:MAG: hypothetical protein ACRBBW_16755 [Cellvibrionaceae bacterium]
MNLDKRALAVVAKELQLHRCKASVWELAKDRARERSSDPKLEYARLRCRELSRQTTFRAANDECFHASSRGEVLAALRKRGLSSAVEGGMLAFITLLLVGFSVASLGVFKGV